MKALQKYIGQKTTFDTLNHSFNMLLDSCLLLSDDSLSDDDFEDLIDQIDTYAQYCQDVKISISRSLEPLSFEEWLQSKKV